MRSFVIEIGPEIVEAARVPFGEAEARFRLELAVSLYQQGLLPRSKARLLAQMSRFEFEEILAKRQIPYPYTETDLEEDVRYVFDRQ